MADAEPEKPTHRRHSRRDTRKPANAPGTAPAFEAAGSSEEPRSSGRTSASRGQTIAYRSRVQSHLAGNKPSGGMGKGTVRIAFALSPGGGLISARIAHSSGNRALDQAALAAVTAPRPSRPRRLA